MNAPGGPPPAPADDPRVAGLRDGVHADTQFARWPRDFGRDGVSGIVSLDRATRAREVSRPGARDQQDAETAIQRLLSRLDGRR